MRAWTGATEPVGCRSKKKKRRKRKKENRGNAGLGEGDRALGLKVELRVEVVQEARVRAHEMARFELLADPGLKKKIVFEEKILFSQHKNNAHEMARLKLLALPRLLRKSEGHHYSCL
jgi:hypothetical protein